MRNLMTDVSTFASGYDVDWNGSSRKTWPLEEQAKLDRYGAFCYFEATLIKQLTYFHLPIAVGLHGFN